MTDREAEPDRAPRVLRVGFGLWAVLGTFLVIRAGIAWTSFGALRDRFARQRGDDPAAAADTVSTLLIANTLIALALAVGYVGLAWLMLRRKQWARIAVSLLAAAHVLLVLLSGAWTGTNLIVLGLAVAGWACCWRAASSEWLGGSGG